MSNGRNSESGRSGVGHGEHNAFESFASDTGSRGGGEGGRKMSVWTMTVLVASVSMFAFGAFVAQVWVKWPDGRGGIASLIFLALAYIAASVLCVQVLRWIVRKKEEAQEELKKCFDGVGEYLRELREKEDLSKVAIVKLNALEYHNRRQFSLARAHLNWHKIGTAVVVVLLVFGFMHLLSQQVFSLQVDEDMIEHEAESPGFTLGFAQRAGHGKYRIELYGGLDDSPRVGTKSRHLSPVRTKASSKELFNSCLLRELEESARERELNRYRKRREHEIALENDRAKKKGGGAAEDHRTEGIASLRTPSAAVVMTVLTKAERCFEENRLTAADFHLFPHEDTPFFAFFLALGLGITLQIVSRMYYRRHAMDLEELLDMIDKHFKRELQY